MIEYSVIYYISDFANKMRGKFIEMYKKKSIKISLRKCLFYQLYFLGGLLNGRSKISGV